MTQIVSVDVICASARAAVDAGQPPAACPYPTDSAAAARWLDAFEHITEFKLAMSAPAPQ